MSLNKTLVRSALLGCVMAMGVSSTAFAYTMGMLNDDKVN